MTGLDWVRDELSAWEANGLLRIPRTVDSAADPEVEIDGKKVILLCSNNYLGLAADPRVRAAASRAARRWGAGAGASRLVSGTARLHRDLEAALAEHESTQDAVLFSSGYLANIGTIGVLTGAEDVVFSDELNHASIVDGCRLSKASVAVYRHADMAHLEDLLSSRDARRRVVVTDTVFSMDGDLAPLAELAELCERRDAILVVDEAHATGVLGRTGAGAVEELGLTGRVPVIVGTLSKSLGSAGGYVATTRDVATLLRNRARTHVFDTASAPAAVAAAGEALRIVGTEPWRHDRVRDLARDAAAELTKLGFTTGDPVAAIVPVYVGDAREAVGLSERLLDEGVFCPAIRPPSVPDGTSRLRVTFMATHTDEHVERVLNAFERTKQQTKPLRRNVQARETPRSKGFFVTGTDTGVGKTLVTAAIAANLKASGLRTAIFKPVQTGTIDGSDDAGYAGRLAACSAETGQALADPLAPSVAARLDGTEVDVDSITRAFERLRSERDVVVVEGAGGLLVPLTPEMTMADLACDLALPLVVVARPALGTLNHTALSIEAARSRGLQVLGVVISGYPSSPNSAEATNPVELERLCGVPIIGVVPYIDGLDVEAGLLPPLFEPARWLGPQLGGTFEREAFLAGAFTYR
ncbi:MAG: 8-amino-7-oxononanoate synthase [Actinomycetota bacterium]